MMLPSKGRCLIRKQVGNKKIFRRLFRSRLIPARSHTGYGMGYGAPCKSGAGIQGFSRPAWEVLLLTLMPLHLAGRVFFLLATNFPSLALMTYIRIYRCVNLFGLWR
jgi:hypothetical protein